MFDHLCIGHIFNSKGCTKSHNGSVQACKCAVACFVGSTSKLYTYRRVCLVGWYRQLCLWTGCQFTQASIHSIVHAVTMNVLFKYILLTGVV